MRLKIKMEFEYLDKPGGKPKLNLTKLHRQNLWMGMSILLLEEICLILGEYIEGKWYKDFNIWGLFLLGK